MPLSSILFAAAAAAASPTVMEPRLPAHAGPTVTAMPSVRDRPRWLLPLPVAGRGVGANPIEYRARQVEFGSGARRFALAYVRQRPIGARDRWALEGPRAPSGWRAMAAYRIGSESGPSLAIEGTMGSDRLRRPSELGDGRLQSARRAELDLAWRPDQRLRLAGGWKGISGNKAWSALDRQILIAKGAPLAEIGPHFSVDLDAAHSSRSIWRLGLDVGSYAIANSDRAALGLAGARDARASLSLRINFR